MGGISIRGLVKSYTGKGDMAALSSLDLEIGDSQFVTLLGPSGCGKTTTLRLIAGYLTPDAGTIHVDGRLLSSPGSVVSPENRGMGMVFQNYAVWPHKTVYENVAFGLKLRRIPASEMKAKVERMLSLVNLAGLEGRFPNELSGGQQQRVALARSLVVEPDILLLDEPLSNLDAKLREHMRSELKELQRRTGITFVYVTHDQAEALALSDQIAVMHGGKLQQYGTPLEVYARPKNRTVADFMGLVNILPVEVLDAGHVRIGSDIVLDMAVPGWATAGTKADLAVRPENVHLKPAGAGEASTLQGTVTERTFLGNLAEYLVRLPGDLVVRAQSHPLLIAEPGAALAVRIDPAECLLFPREAGAKPLATAA
ncbi:ABC transporter ATP-binding protein [Ancylobacter terrae]|uniref:ABC transporter ATP-binding protein n=1 Tax=Ancylobacter sp. sgz301288 TaxID=3342077 RepID=UPI00385A118A